MNNATLFTADQTTHLKIVAVALVASITVSLIGIGVHATRVTSGPHLRTASHTVMAGS